MKYFSEDYKDNINNEDTIEDSIHGSGGGCFPADTLVLTSDGYKPIQKLKPNAIIIGYDTSGYLEFSLVTETIIHESGTYEDDLYFIESENVSLFPKGITGNHAVYNKKENNHKEIKDFKLGDILTDVNGKDRIITKIDIVQNKDLSIPVYNLIVEPTHTYIVGGINNPIRVHNGGGGKKSGGGAARAAQESPNTLQSSAVAKVLEVISHGEIVGIVGGRKGVYFDKTPLQSSAGNNNYNNIFFDSRVGTPDQDPIKGFDEVEAEDAITPQEILTSIPVLRTVSSNVPTARVTIQFPEGLWFQDKSNGDLKGFSVSYAIDVAITGGAFQTVLTKTINDKAVSAV